MWQPRVSNGSGDTRALLRCVSFTQCHGLNDTLVSVFIFKPGYGKAITRRTEGTRKSVNQWEQKPGALTHHPHALRSPQDLPRCRSPDAPLGAEAQRLSGTLLCALVPC